MVGAAEPDHFERLGIVFMVRLDGLFSADCAGTALDLPSPHVHRQVRPADVFGPLFLG
jgi:hypothetical protein